VQKTTIFETRSGTRIEVSTEHSDRHWLYIKTEIGAASVILSPSEVLEFTSILLEHGCLPQQVSTAKPSNSPDNTSLK